MIPFENFDTNKEKFSCYIERFENYLLVMNVTSQDKKAQLLNVSIGATHYNNLSALIGPENSIKDRSYTDLVADYKKMLLPHRSPIVSQHCFLNINQKDNETIAEFVISLRRAISDCDFVVKCSCELSISAAELFLQAQFIRGLRDNWIREHLLQSSKTKFDEFVSLAMALEASRADSRILNNRLSIDPVDTNRISKSSQHNHRFRKSTYTRDFSPISPQPSGSPSPRSSMREPSKSRSVPVDFCSLGIENLCLRCAKSNHRIRDCRVARESIKCNACNKIGHVARVCISTLLQSQKKLEVTKHVQEDNVIYPDYDYSTSVEMVESNIVDLYEIKSGLDKYYAEVLLNGVPQKFEVDSGARFSLLSESDFECLHLNVPIENTKISFRSYSDHIITPKGKVTLTITYNNRTISGELFIVPGGRDALLGREWIRGLCIELREIDKQMNSVQPTRIHTISSLDSVMQEFSTVFEERIGCVPNYEVQLQLRANAKPVFFRERDVPYALRERVEKELDSLEEQGVISPVAISDWGSPLVVIPKADGGVRLCVDYKCGVNERLVSANTPIRRIDDVLNSLRNSKFFCKLDLHKAYLHLKVDDESSKIQTISTHRGTYTVNRLSFGIKTAPAEFNRILSQILKNVPKTEAYFDDIICHGASQEECLENLRACLKRLAENDLHVNRSKCLFFKEKIEYLGHVVEHNRIQKSPQKVKAVSEMKTPTNVDEVRRFLGMVTYYSRFIPHFSSISYPLRCLLRKNERFVWTQACQSAFTTLKMELCSDRVLTPYDPSLQIILTTDASPTGIAAVISHKINGQERPIAYASRSLSVAETNYSQLDREATAVIYGVQHFYNYLFGRNFILVSDNEPLTRIFHHNSALPKMTSARLLRYASFLSSFDYTVKFKKGEDNKNVDCLSRAPVFKPGHSVETVICAEVNNLYEETLSYISGDVITVDTIRSETLKDPELQQVVRRLRSKPSNEPYTLNNGILFRLDRVVIPTVLRSAVLAELHATHLGIMKTKQLARRYVYWPKIDHDIEVLVKSCKECAITQNNPSKVYHPWIEPEGNWERVHVDYAGPFLNHHFLVCVDAKSKWAEIQVIRDAPTSTSTMSLLEQIFTTHGYPCVLVSDNATVFTSDTFKKYCKDRGIFQKFIAPGHPSTNGLAERNVQTLKQRLRAATNDSTPLSVKVRNILFRYRATPLACGESPADKYLHRRLRIRLDALLPNPHSLKKSIVTFTPTRSFKEGERVLVRLYIDNKDIWQFGSVSKKLGKLHYEVILDSGRRLKRHLDQLKSTSVQDKRVTFSPEVEIRTPPPVLGVPMTNTATPGTNNTARPILPATVVPHPIPEPSLRRSTRTRQLPRHLQDYAM